MSINGITIKESLATVDSRYQQGPKTDGQWYTYWQTAHRNVVYWLLECDGRTNKTSRENSFYTINQAMACSLRNTNAMWIFT